MHPVPGGYLFYPPAIRFQHLPLQRAPVIKIPRKDHSFFAKVSRQEKTGKAILQLVYINATKFINAKQCFEWITSPFPCEGRRCCHQKRPAGINICHGAVYPSRQTPFYRQYIPALFFKRTIMAVFLMI